MDARSDFKKLHLFLFFPYVCSLHSSPLTEAHTCFLTIVLLPPHQTDRQTNKPGCKQGDFRVSDGSRWLPPPTDSVSYTSAQSSQSPTLCSYLPNSLCFPFARLKCFALPVSFPAIPYFLPLHLISSSGHRGNLPPVPRLLSVVSYRDLLFYSVSCAPLKLTDSWTLFPSLRREIHPARPPAVAPDIKSISHPAPKPHNQSEQSKHLHLCQNRLSTCAGWGLTDVASRLGDHTDLLLTLLSVISISTHLSSLPSECGQRERTRPCKYV